MYSVDFIKNNVRKTIYDAEDDRYSIVSSDLHIGIGESGTFNFSVARSHPNFSFLSSIVGRLEVKNDEDVIYRGRIIRKGKDWNNTAAIQSEGVLSCLNDSSIGPFEFPNNFLSREDYQEAATTGNVVEFFVKWLLQKHNDQVGIEQRIKPGVINVTDSNNYISRSNDGYVKTWEILKRKVFETPLGGYYRIRYESDGNYLDYVSDLSYFGYCDQEIKYGENLIDVSDDEDSSTLFTAILPIGADNLTIEDLPNQLITSGIVKEDSIVYSLNGAMRYGVITHIQQWQDVTEAQNLLQKSVSMLQSNGNLFGKQITISAHDLHLSDEEVEHFEIGKIIPVYSEPHDITAEYPLMSIDMDILNPGSAMLKLSDKVDRDSISGAISSSSMASDDNLKTALAGYYTKGDVDNKLLTKVSNDDFGTALAAALADSDLNVGGTLTVGGITIDGYARFA